MKEKYLLVYKNKRTGEIYKNFFLTLEDMKDFIRVNINQKHYWKIIGKYDLIDIHC